MTKELFLACINAYKHYDDFEGRLDGLGLNLWEIPEIENLKANFLNLLADSCKDEYPEGYVPNNIDFFIFDCEFGEKADEHPIIEPDGNKIFLKTPEDLWEYRVKCNPEIETT